LCWCFCIRSCNLRGNFIKQRKRYGVICFNLVHRKAFQLFSFLFFFFLSFSQELIIKTNNFVFQLQLKIWMVENSRNWIFLWFFHNRSRNIWQIWIKIRQDSLILIVYCYIVICQRTLTIFFQFKMKNNTSQNKWYILI
jgi:hypothetical protein